MLKEIKVPSVGESVTEALLAQWFKADGDLVKKEEPLFVIETDKITLEVVAEADGVLSIKVPEGETVAIGAVVGDDKGRLLLIQRADSGVWLYPTGWADVGYSPAEVAVKEVLEETGIHCEVVRPMSIIDGMRAGFSRIPLYSIVFHCRAVGGDLAAHPQECLDVGWFGPDELPEPLASGDRWKDLAFATINGTAAAHTTFDPPRAPVWRRPD